jgi:hypothetical protein
MSFNGSGTFSINSTGQPVVSGTTISDTVHNALTADIATGLTNCITRDGQSPATANIPLGSNKITGLASGTAATDAPTLAQVQSSAVQFFTAGGTADVITGTLSPVISAYAAGQTFRFVASGANTTNVTLNLNSLGAKAVTKNGTTALVAGDIPSGQIVTVTYDGTQFQLVGKHGASSGANGDITSLTAAAGVDVHGTNTNDDAASGYMGEYISSTVTSPSAVALTTATGATVTSIALTAGDWDVTGVVAFGFTAATVSNLACSVGTNATTLTTAPERSQALPNLTGSSGTWVQPIMTTRFSVSGATTLYLVAQCTFTGTGAAAYGRISARRVR